MSCSSSTTRISSAINSTPVETKMRSFGGLAPRAGRQWLAGEAQGGARAPARGGGEADLSAVLLDDLLHDREAKAGALLARGHIRLDDVLPPLRQPDPVVGDGDGEEPAIHRGRHPDPSAEPHPGVSRPRFNGFGGILEHVSHRLAELVAVAIDRRDRLF